MKFIQYTFLMVELCLVGASSHLVRADSLPESKGDARHFSISSTARFQSWHLTSLSDNTETRLTQLSIPWQVFFPISDRTHFLISQLNAASGWRLESVDSQVKADVPEVRLEGVGDTRVKFSHKLSPSFLVILGLNIPTGKNELEEKESIVSNALYDDALDFRVGRLGEGWGFDLATAYARTIAGITFGAGASYYYKGSYDKGSFTCSLGNSDGNLEYNPGSELNLTGGFNFGSRALQWRSDLIYTIHTKEKVRGHDCFKQGQDLLAESELTYTKQGLQLSVFRQWLWRGKSKRPDEAGKLELPLAELNDRRLLGLSGAYQIGRRTAIRGFVESKHLAENEDKRGGANVWAYGVSAHFEVTRGLGLTLGIKMSDGELTSEEVDLSGLGYYGALNTQF